MRYVLAYSTVYGLVLLIDQKDEAIRVFFEIEVNPYFLYVRYRIADL